MDSHIEFIKLSTLVQAKFQLMQKKVLYFDLCDGMGYAFTEKGNNIKIVTVSSAGRSSEAVINLYKFEQFYEAYRPEVYILKDNRLAAKKKIILDKFADFLEITKDYNNNQDDKI